MGHIGKAIKEHRTLLKMTRKDLAKNICTENYLYLIENNKRTPSSDILRLFSEKMGVDLAYYYSFLDCHSPMQVSKTILSLAACQRSFDFKKAEKITKSATKIKDFKNTPWIYILNTNKLACKMFVEKKYEEVIEEAEALLENVEENYLNSVYVVNLYMLISTGYQILGKTSKAAALTQKACDLVRHKKNFKHYDHVFVTAYLNLLTLHYLSDEFDKAILVGEDLVSYQRGANSYARIHITYAYLSFSYYKIKEYDKAFLNFEKAIYLLLAFPNQEETFYITSQGVFYEMLNNERMAIDLVSRFKQIYNEG